MKGNKAVDDDFLETKLTYGIVLRGNVEEIKKLKKLIKQDVSLQVVYQRLSGNKLKITEQ